MQQPDFKYYTPEDFLNDDISQSKSMPFFSTIHFNIRSLSANHDGLTMLLSDLQHSFDVIGLSETKIKSNSDLTSNIAIEGYDFAPSQLWLMLVVWGSSSKRGFNFIFEMIFVQRQKNLNLYELRLIVIHIKIFCALSYIDTQEVKLRTLTNIFSQL